MRNKMDYIQLKKQIEESQRFGGKVNIPASKETTKYIENATRSQILINVPSALHPSARFLVIKNPNASRSQDKVLMAITSDPKRRPMKMFSFFGTHVSHQKAMDFAKKHKLVAMKDKDGNPLYAKESVEQLDEVAYVKVKRGKYKGMTGIVYSSNGYENSTYLVSGNKLAGDGKPKIISSDNLENAKGSDRKTLIKIHADGKNKIPGHVQAKRQMKDLMKESVELDERKYDKSGKGIVPKWEKDLKKATSKVKGVVRGLKNGKEVYAYRTGGLMISSAVGVLFRDFKADTVEILQRGKVVYTLKKKDVMKNGKMIDESVEGGDLSDIIGNAILKSKKIKKGAKESDIISAINNELRNKKPKLSRNAMAFWMRDRDFLADTLGVVKRGLKESIELDEVKISRNPQLKLGLGKGRPAGQLSWQQKQLRIINFINAVEKNKKSWKSKVTPQGMRAERGDWTVVVGDPERGHPDIVTYNNKNMPFKPKGGKLPFDKFMKLLDVWKKEYNRMNESVELDEGKTEFAVVAKASGMLIKAFPKEEHARMYIKNQYRQRKNLKGNLGIIEVPKSRAPGNNMKKHGEIEVVKEFVEINEGSAWDAILRIKDQQTAEKVHGVLVDMQTAKLLCDVMYALNKGNQKKFMAAIDKNAMGLKKMVDFAWKQVK